MPSRRKDTARLGRNPGAVGIQCGALCWRWQGSDLKVLLVTSRDTGRWVIPKGHLIPDLTPQASAAREAWEEAGVEGAVADLPIGVFTYDKIMGPGQAIPCTVTVYPLEVTRLRDRYPERVQRQRKWFAPDRAAAKVAEPGLCDILMAFSAPQPPPGGQGRAASAAVKTAPS
ncbi:MAG: NUDIX hydrolase [Rhodobacter sp.]|nr:NUDIX hydrolase [Rhodobacter sp.]MCA3457650.1 NUDIX hydrolase [Rhodobacter sp.]MCA3459740.1 NUDIX hydrolase [Rhodobacter sp.]MCA3464294.1 NUDIX hydrolase [Rhodobacter sp.]MCA3467606.1 NUDIX hydrolase [Rhodobacter sp.]